MPTKFFKGSNEVPYPEYEEEDDDVCVDCGRMKEECQCPDKVANV